MENGAIGIVTMDKFSPTVSHITEIFGTEGIMFCSQEANNPFQTVPLAVYTAKDYNWEEYPEIMRKYRYPDALEFNRQDAINAAEFDFHEEQIVV